MDPNVLAVSHSNMLVLVGVSLLDVVLMWAYLKAMESDEPTVVVVFYQLVPVLGPIFGYLILGETVSMKQLGAMAVTIIGTAIVAFELNEDGIKLKKETIKYMLIACACWALESTIFKKVALEENVWRSAFWEHLALGVVGIGIFVFMPKYRQGFLRQFKKNSRTVVGLNAINEMLFMTGNMAMAFAALMAPIALVLFTNAYQPIFVMAIGIILAVFFPKFATEKVKGRHLVQKLIAIAITGFGTYLLLSSGAEF
jgi:drug/metabolite transporter (DMT)-like permease